MAEAIDTFKQECESLSGTCLKANPEKSKGLSSWPTAASAAISEGRAKGARHGLVMLGSPVGSNEFVGHLTKPRALEQKHNNTLHNVKKAAEHGRLLPTQRELFSMQQRRARAGSCTPEVAGVLFRALASRGERPPSQ